MFTLPITPYRSFHKAEIVNSCRVVHGIQATISDNCSLALMVESLGWGSVQWREALKMGKRCLIQYHTAPEDLLAAGDLIMCKYVMRTEGHEEVGVQGGPVVQHGMMQCKFNREHRMVSAEMVFDVMGFMQQLQRASSISPESSIVPNTLEMALQPTREARAIIRCHPPHHMAIHVNEAWTLLLGHTQSEAEGIPLTRILRVDPSQYGLLNSLSREVAAGRPGSAIVISGGEGTRALLYVKVMNVTLPHTVNEVFTQMFPLTGDSDIITHFLVVVCDLPLSEDEQQSIYAGKAPITSGADVEALRQSLQFPLGANKKQAYPFNYIPSLSDPRQGYSGNDMGN